MNDQMAVNLFKGLVIDAVAKAKSGHPGGPMSSMDLAYLLFTEYLRFDPEDPEWIGRDRFILSAGHMSMLQYAMLYGIGWLTMDDLKAFRQLHSRTPGHPENFMTPGVECTTGPLGQGAGMSVGFSVAAAHLSAVLDKELFSHRTWALVSDGDMQEGVAMGAASIAGHLGLGNLVWIYDKNNVQLSGPTEKTVSDEEEQVFSGFGWNVLNIDGHDHAQIREAYDKALENQDAPTLIVANTVIGKGAHSMEHSFKTHGAPLPDDEKTKTKEKLGLPADKEFHAPDELVTHFRRNFDKRKAEARAWKDKLEKRMGEDQSFQKAFEDRFGRQDYSKLPPIDWPTDKPIATRNAFGDLISGWAEKIPALMGGSADLEPSNMTAAFAKATGDFSRHDYEGRNLNFGVREFPMSALTNGLALHGGIIPFDATFLTFSDYSRPALRLGALQKVRVIHEFTHDSIYLGEDGPTHQPVEHVMSLRTIPDFYVMRPADAVETEILFRKALELRLPSAMCLTRQKMPLLPVSRETAQNASRGAYTVREVEDPDLVLLATGSEVTLALQVADALTDRKAKVVSMPSWELFEEQSKTYREDVLSPSCKARVSLEAGTTLGWERYTGDRGLSIGIDTFGASAPGPVLGDYFGFTVDKVIARIKEHSFS